ncbi:MAG: hypothetical protein M1536_02745 [Firmicutes bacterium]|nr:hypothetical protein [Bacillota bacterium]
MSFARKTFLLLVIFLVFSLLNFSLLTGAEESPQKSCSHQIPLVIFYTSNINGVMDKDDLPGGRGGGLDRIATIITLLKRVQPYYLLLDSGGSFSGTPLVDYFKGKPAVEVMNFMKYDAAVPGLCDFTWGTSVLKKRIRDAKFPLLAANITDSAGRQWDGTVPYIIKEIGSIKVAILGLTTAGTFERQGKGKLEGIYFNDPVETAKLYVSVLRAKSDIVIVISQLGLKEEKKLALKVDGIDLIIGGCSTEAISYPVKTGSALILHAGSKAEFLGWAEIVFEESSECGLHIVKINGKETYPGPQASDFSYKEPFLIPVQDSVIPDRDIVEILKPYREKLLNKR